MTEKSSSDSRVPAAASGIQVNHCKNPECPNFRVSESAHRGRLPKGGVRVVGDYGHTSTGKGKPAMKCLLCGDIIGHWATDGSPTPLTTWASLTSKSAGYRISILKS
jgi:hypothetical protein